MCLQKYVLSGMNVVHNILCVDWLKNLSRAIFEENSLDCSDIPSFVAKLILLCCDIIALCHDKDWLSLLKVAGNYVATLFFFVAT